MKRPNTYKMRQGAHAVSHSEWTPAIEQAAAWIEAQPEWPRELTQEYLHGLIDSEAGKLTNLAIFSALTQLAKIAPLAPKPKMVDVALWFSTEGKLQTVVLDGSLRDALGVDVVRVKVPRAE